MTTKTVVKTIMTPNPVVIPENTTLSDAARIMRDKNLGILPVGTSGKLNGILTDRDIVVRALIRNDDNEKNKVSDFMTERVLTCQETDTANRAAAIMHKHQVSRLIVKNKDGDITGIISYGDLLKRQTDISGVLKKSHNSRRPKAA